MTIQYVMRATLNISPGGYVYWAVLESPDYTGSQSGYNPENLTNIGIEYQINVPINGSGGVVADIAGGDLTGVYPNPVVAGIQGNPVTATTPSNGQVFNYNGSEWVPGSINLSNTNSVSGILPAINQGAQTLTGDVTGVTTSNTVDKIQGNPVSANSIANDGYALISKSGAWTPIGAIPVLNIRNFGATGNGTTDDSNAFLQAAADVASGAILHLTAGTYRISSNVTLPSSLNLFFCGGTTISVDSGKTLTIGGGVQANPQQYLFDGYGTVLLTGVADVHAEWFGAGNIADLGIALNAADTALGSNAGTVHVNCNGGNLATAAVVGTNHTWLLGTGLYTATTAITESNAWGAPFILGNYATLQGMGDATILQETTGSTYPVVLVPETIAVGTSVLNVGGFGYAQIRNLQIAAAPSNSPTEDASTLNFGNARDMIVDNCLFTKLNGFPIQLGGFSETYTFAGTVTAENGSPNISGSGTSFELLIPGQVIALDGYAYTVASITNNTALVLTTNFAETSGSQTMTTNNFSYNCSINNCRFDSIYGQNIAVVNASLFTITGNRFYGCPTVAVAETFIDCEVNAATDSLNNFVISNNVFDITGHTDPVGHPAGIYIDATDTTGQGQGVVANNAMVGVVSGQDWNFGIALADVSHVLVTGNQMWQVLNGIIMGTCTSCSAIGNAIDYATGFAILFQDSTTNCIAAYNTANLGGSPFFTERDSEGYSSDYNIFANNIAVRNLGNPGVPPTLVGAHSMAVDNVINGVVSSQSAGRAVSCKTVNSNYTVDSTGVPDSYLLLNSNSGGFTVTMPVPTLGRKLCFADDGYAASHNITLSPNSSEKIAGGSSLVFTKNYDCFTLTSLDGVNWFITASYSSSVVP